MTVFEQQQRLAPEVGHAQRVVRGERMAFGKRHGEGLAVQLARLEAGHLDRQGENAHIELPAVQLLEHRRGLVLVQAQLQARQAPADRGCDLRQQVRADGRQQRHPQLAGERIALAARQRDDLVARLQDAPRARHDLFPGRGKRDVVGCPFDELHPEGLLEFFQLRRQRRLADEAARGRAAEVPVIGHGHQVAQVLELQLHDRDIRNLSRR